MKQLMTRSTVDAATVLDKGGRPTVRELLGGLQFDPATGALRLNGARVALNLSEADRILRRDLIRLLGEDEARIFLIRRGFQMGKHDAAFVASSWPSLDRRDAFTAGTRLHTFSGIVRVETIHNDFDFARGRFSAEFLWHNSIEADAGGDMPRPADRPACWQQLGYASGYASHFFGTLVVYKETSCAAQGHTCCTVVGRLAEGWGDNDPDVIQFRTRVLTQPLPADRSGLAAIHLADANAALDAAGALILSPILSRLKRAAAFPLPCVIAGQGSCGQEIAVAHLARLLGPATDTMRLRGAMTDAEALHTAFASLRKTRRKDPRPGLLIIEELEKLSPSTQAELAGLLSETDAQPAIRVIATMGQSLRTSGTGGMDPALWAKVAALSIELPALSHRASDIPALAERLIPRLVAQLALSTPEIETGAFESFAQTSPAQGLQGLEAVLTATLIESPDRITADAIAAQRRRIEPTARQSGDAFDQWLDQQFAAGSFSLEAHEAYIRGIAMARSKGNLAAAARLLGLSRAQLAYRLKAPKQ